MVDILAAVKRTAIPKPHDLGFCFFPEGFFAAALTDLLCSGLMVALQTDTASPAAKMFLLALISRSWCVPQSGQSHSRIFNGIFGSPRLCVIIFAYGILKCLLDKTFRTILRIFYQYRPRFHTETRRAHFLSNIPAITTPLRTGKPSIYFDVISPIPTAFIG
jgi:hypothetical protein